MKARLSPALMDIVLVGAGHAHVGVLRSLGMDPAQRVRLTLITRQVHTPYSGMLPGLVAGHYDFDQVHIDTGPLARFAGARFYQDEVIGLDLAGRRVICRGRPPVAFDVLSIDIGSTPGGADVPGVAEHAIPVKPIDRFLDRFEAARARVLAVCGRLRIGVVGGGAAGVELALALRERLRRDVVAAGGDPEALYIAILCATPTILPGLPAVRARMERVLAARGIVVLDGARVVGVEAGSVATADGRKVAIDELFWTTQARAAPWLSETGLALDDAGFIAVDDALQSISHPGVFAAGDVAAMQSRDLPKSGVYAVRQGPVLTENLRRSARGAALKSYRPQKEALYLISTGDRYAVGARNGLSAEGAWVWRWKDHIDRTFMARFSALPEMAQSATGTHGAEDGMRCRGCGAKVGAGILGRVRGRIVAHRRQDVLIGLEAPDDAAVVDLGDGRLSVQTVDYFPAFIDDPYTFGRIAANHALGDIYAMGAEPQTAMAVVALPHATPLKAEADLTDLMTGANEVLAEAGCALVGGHTSEGAELALGFAVTGTTTRDKLLRKNGIQAGHAIILTKPIGTGTLLAADMRRKAKSRWLMAALASMQVSSRLAAEVLARHAMCAATDVTGFGLLGHLVEMAEASGVDVVLRLAAIPVLDGARETVAAGILSSLHEENARAASAIRNLSAVANHAAYPLLLDPQTAGGLLAAVPSSRADAAVADLRSAGYAEATVIGMAEARTAEQGPIVIET